jgi:hypothetical protein
MTATTAASASAMPTTRPIGVCLLPASGWVMISSEEKRMFVLYNSEAAV